MTNKRGNMEKEKTNPHKNHRKRLRNKVEKYGLDCLEYHEILELLLTYTISRKEVERTEMHHKTIMVLFTEVLSLHRFSCFLSCFFSWIFCIL